MTENVIDLDTVRPSATMAERICEYLEDWGSAAAWQLARDLGVTKKQIDGVLGRLKDRGLVELGPRAPHDPSTSRRACHPRLWQIVRDIS